MSDLLRFFEYKHLPPLLQAVSRPFHNLAHLLNDTVPDSLEKEAGLRKLLESKDCYVRAALPIPNAAPPLVD